jgi:hypothetical protein
MFGKFLRTVLYDTARFGIHNPCGSGSPVVTKAGGAGEVPVLPGFLGVVFASCQSANVMYS